MEFQVVIMCLQLQKYQINLHYHSLKRSIQMPVLDIILSVSLKRRYLPPLLLMSLELPKLSHAPPQSESSFGIWIAPTMPIKQTFGALRPNISSKQTRLTMKKSWWSSLKKVVSENLRTFTKIGRSFNL